MKTEAHMEYRQHHHLFIGGSLSEQRAQVGDRISERLGRLSNPVTVQSNSAGLSSTPRKSKSGGIFLTRLR